MSAPGLTARLGSDGGVVFSRAGREMGLGVAPVRVLTRVGRDVTPVGLEAPRFRGQVLVR